MAPKKKGKQNKLAKMSDDERMRYLQHKLAMEEEARRRKQQLIATFLKNKIKKEEGFARLNEAKINEQWRQILRRAKCKELQLELENSRQLFEHMLLKKEKMIRSLLNDLQESERQYLVILQAHMESVDKIISMGSTRVNREALRYVEQREKLIDMANMESNNETNRNNNSQQLLLTVLFATKESAKNTQQIMQNKALAKRTNIRNCYSEEMQALQIRLGGHLEKLQESLELVFRSYACATQEQRRMYEEMKERDTENLQIITQHTDTIITLQTEDEKLQQQMSNLEMGTSPRTTKLQKQERELSALCWQMRKRNQNLIKFDEIKIINITNASSKVIEKLQKLKEKGENVIKLSLLCSKLETEEEKIILKRKFEEECSYDSFSDPTPPEPQIQNIHGMENFWERHSQALLSRAALRMHYETLIDENNKLRNAMKQYMATAASCTSNSNNVLLQTKRIKGRSITLGDGKQISKSPVCIEAAIAVKNILK